MNGIFRLLFFVKVNGIIMVPDFESSDKKHGAKRLKIMT